MYHMRVLYDTVASARVNALGRTVRNGLAAQSFQVERPGVPVELQQYVTILRERWISAVMTAALVISAVGLATMLATPVYESTTRLFVQTRTSSDIGDLNSGMDYASQRLYTYTDLATSPLVLDRVVEELDLGYSSAQLANQISTSVPSDTVILEISVRSSDPERAAAIANTTASFLNETVAELEAADGTSTVELTVISPGLVPTSPAGPDLMRNLALGVLLGVLAGIAVAVGREVLDNRVRTSADVSSTAGIPIIASIPAARDHHRAPLISSDNAQSIEAESYRELRTNLRFTALTCGSRSILLTSSQMDEGKSVTAINLAVVLAQDGKRVLLIDADLRRPSIAPYLGLEGGVGLTTVLIGEAEIEDVSQPLETPGLEVLAAGTIPPNPSEMLGSPAMRAVLAKAVEAYDHVIIDSPPLLAVTDAVLLSDITDGTLVVARSGTVRKAQLRAALDKLSATDAHVLGVVLNRVPRRTRDAYAEKYSYTSATASENAPSGDGQSSRADGASIQRDEEQDTRARRRRAVAASKNFPSHRAEDATAQDAGSHGSDATTEPVDPVPSPSASRP